MTGARQAAGTAPTRAGTADEIALGMRAAIVCLMLCVRAAWAQPGAQPAAYEACLARRSAAMKEAQQIDDLRERVYAFSALPDCSPLVAVAPLPAPAAEPPFAARTRVAVRVGVHSTLLINEGGQKGSGLLFDAEAGRRYSRRLSVTGFVSIAEFRDSAAYDDGTEMYYASSTTLVDLGARVNLHVDAFLLGAGAGGELGRERRDDRQRATWGPPLGLVELFGGLDLGEATGFTVTAGVALGNVATFPYGFVGVRLAAGLQF